MHVPNEIIATQSMTVPNDSECAPQRHIKSPLNSHWGKNS